MDEFFKWLSSNTIAATSLIVAFGIGVISVTLIYVVSFLQGRELSFWPPKIGARPDKAKRESDTNNLSLPEGQIISRNDRSSVSQTFAKSALRSVNIFAGDLSGWFERDLPIYRDLSHRGVKIRILIDEPNATAVQAGKLLGVEIRRYPNQITAPLKASIFDADDETECRALIVKRRASRLSTKNPGEYEYLMKSYHGPIDFPVIKAMSLLFDELYSQGEQQ